MTTAKSRAWRESGAARVVPCCAPCRGPSGGRDCRSGRSSEEIAGPLAAFGERVHVADNVLQLLKVVGTHEPPAARWTGSAQEGDRAQEWSTRNPCRPRLRPILEHANVATNATIGTDTQRPENQAPRERILIVEDHAPLARTLAGKINQFGGEGVAVGTVCEALGELGEPAGFAGVILDLCLPDGPGVRVLGSLRNYGGSDLPVLVLTGNPDRPAIDAAYNFRAQILEKPATSTQLEQFFRFAQQYARSRSHVGPTVGSATPDGSGPGRPEADLDHRRGEVAPTGRGERKDYRGGVSSIPKTPGRFSVYPLSDAWLARTLAAVDAVATNHELSPVERAILAAAVQGHDRRSIIEARQVSPNTLKTQIHRLLIKTGHATLDELRDTILRSLSGPEGTNAAARSTFPVNDRVERSSR
jgi:DNA-binding NarL/FixJ family response regulator